MQAHVGTAASAVQSSAARHPHTLFQLLISGAIEGTRTPTPLPVHGPEPCASANSATMAIWTATQRRPRGRRVRKTNYLIFTAPSQAVKPPLSEPVLCAVKACSVLPKPESQSPKPHPTPASPSSKSSRSAPSTPDSPSRPPRRTSEMPPHPLPEPSPLHRCGSP